MARKSDKEKKKKKQSELEAAVFALLEKSLKTALDAALKDLSQYFK